MFRLTTGGVLIVAMAAAAVEAPPETRKDLVVHEWGTFTTVAAQSGAAVAWRPLEGPIDLPCFVERTSQPGKYGFATTVRMETPVIYFYADAPARIDLSVDFMQGSITEVFPRAAQTRMGVEWRNIEVTPGAQASFHEEAAPNHYYAARKANAAPLQVGTQREGFLFYRGVAGFTLPLTAMAGTDGAVTLRNDGADAIDGVMLFENQNGRINFTVQSQLAGARTIALGGKGGDVAGVRRALVRMLVSSGLFAAEAEAMVATWDTSWFEEGSRVFYIVPPRLVDEVLPLSIRPAPKSLTRVFVGRIELPSPHRLRTIEEALVSGDAGAIDAHGRFLEPFARMVLATGLDYSRRYTVDTNLRAAITRLGYRSPQKCETTTPSAQ
jgi:hypothetical protein